MPVVDSDLSAPVDADLSADFESLDSETNNSTNVRGNRPLVLSTLAMFAGGVKLSSYRTSRY